MNAPTHPSKRWLILVLLASLFATNALAGCDLLPASTPTPTPLYPTPVPTQPLPEAMVTFRVTLPAPLQPGEKLSLTTLDEVTGLALNPTHHTMAADDATHYTVILPFAVGSVVKYRFTRQGAFLSQEHISDGRPVRYRLHHVDGPGVLNDIVSRWTDTAFTGPTGRISGKITDAATGQPIPNILVEAGGAQALTTSDGAYVLEGLPPGTHNLSAYALDGSYRTYQQGAVVAADAATPADLALTAAPLVTIVFTVIVPRGTLPVIPVRLAGNLLQLGNTFADLSGGINSVAASLPVLAPLPDGRYSLTLTLPAGADVRYKYTLGDGLWNAEHTAAGDFRIRQLIVPEANARVDELIETWRVGDNAPITFDVNIPANTPQGEAISIQFNPGYSWTMPIPMWKVNDRRWMYILYSPMNMLSGISYRYCREDQCSRADDSETMGDSTSGLRVSTSLLAQDIVDDVISWAWLPTDARPATVPNVAVKPRGPTFMAGVEFLPAYDPTWTPRTSKALNDAHSIGANWLVMTPGWSFTRSEPPVFELKTGADPLWPESMSTILQARNLGMNVALFPAAHFPENPSDWWQKSPRDFAWWVSWFEQYRMYALHHADLATRSGAGALILGGDWLNPALPGGVLADGSASGIPADADTRWRAIIQEVRARYKGVVMWALPYDNLQNPPPFLDAVDFVYVLWTPPLATSTNATAAEMQIEAGRLLDEVILPFQQKINKGAIIAAAYPSADGGIAGCVRLPEGGCLASERLAQPGANITGVTWDLQEQADAYNALLLAINSRDWTAGFVSRGYYPPIGLQDLSFSIHGKPASGVLWFWFPLMLAKPGG